MPMPHCQTELLSLCNQELSDLMQRIGEPRFRARQLADAIFRQRRESLDDVSNLPASLKNRLANDGIGVGLPTIEQRFTSTDGTVRYLIALADGESVETVWMPDGDFGEAGDGSEAGAEELAELTLETAKPRGVSKNENIGVKSVGNTTVADRSHRESQISRFEGDVARRSRIPKAHSRATICVSSQVGCAVNCQFCLTALLGVKRNLSPGEIVGQVLTVLRDHAVNLDRERMNIVFMGMGEPFLNYDNFMKAVRLLVQEVGFPESRMTVSTSGIVPRICDFGAETIRPKLAISLNAPNDEIRERIMPITRKWTVETLLRSARQFPLRSRERLTFEYVLLAGVNDAPEHAREVAQRLGDIRCKVNLIAFNPGPGVPYHMPTHERVLEFQSILVGAGLPAFIRRPRGRDIYAACGQLKRTLS
ncbi:MAG TPA: 23S rRNA (adenine(2503)-C(2))-methyltransferase RlmN [Terriglobales bacterium]|nr:23S rRNA (adenine(2503)-C(2))-methyltransferase RlmN [Terriglobales bacterium]